MKGAALFCLDWLIEDKDGNLVTNPSTSPENAYLNEKGEKCNVSIASTMDMSIIRELFGYCISACRILGVDADFSSELEKASARLLPYKIGKSDNCRSGHRILRSLSRGTDICRISMAYILEKWRSMQVECKR